MEGKRTQMINNKLIGITYFIFSSFIFGQTIYDARMLGLNGSNTTLARGYQCIGVNPANLGTYNNRSVNLLNLSLGLSNNAFSITNYNAINGANFEDTLSPRYIPKSQVYEMFGGEGIRLMQSLNLPLPILNFSTRRFAQTKKLFFKYRYGASQWFFGFTIIR